MRPRPQAWATVARKGIEKRRAPTRGALFGAGGVELKLHRRTDAPLFYSTFLRWGRTAAFARRNGDFVDKPDFKRGGEAA